MENLRQNYADDNKTTDTYVQGLTFVRTL